MDVVASRLACAVLPTATKDHEEKRNTTMAPSRPPMNTSGTAMSTCKRGEAFLCREGVRHASAPGGQ